MKYILKFIDVLKQKREADEKWISLKNSTDAVDIHQAAQDKIYFNLGYHKSGVPISNIPLITLDEEDLQYFEKKYKPMLVEEKEKELNDILKKYKKYE